MTALYRDSEKVAPTGSIISKGIINHLGRPGHDVLAVLVREAVQNSWDARISDTEPVHFKVAGWTLNIEQRNLMRRLFADLPPKESLPLVQFLSSEERFHVLAVSDRGTTGLGGPTRADVITSQDEPRDFVDFLRNVGQPPDKKLSGGTYGYGKAAFYRASAARTICVYTRCKAGRGLESRFIASALGEAYSTAENRYTGRHWWGVRQDDIAEPLLNDAADDLADSLGLLPFEVHESGTTVLILQPIFSEKQMAPQLSFEGFLDRTPEQAVNLMAEYLLWYFWPKMLIFESEQSAVIFEVSWQGKQIDIPYPADIPPLQGFVEAVYRLKNYGMDEHSPFRYKVEDISSQRPAQHLGRLALQQFPTSAMRYFDTGDSSSPFSELTHHTALMRQPELIVKYLPGPVPLNERLGYSGVFISGSEVDSIFADSEPPTHDDWVPKSLEHSWHKRYVNAALREIEKNMESFAKPPALHVNSTALTPLGAFATRLGNSLLPAEQGPAAVNKPFAVRPAQPSQQDTYPPTKTSASASADAGAQNQPLYRSEEPPFANHSSAVSTPEVQPESLQFRPPTPTSSSPPAYAPPEPPPLYEPPKFVSPRFEHPASTPKRIIGRAKVNALSDRYTVFDGQPALEIEFTVTHAGHSAGSLIEVSARAVLNGSQLENEPPIGGSQAQVLCWMGPNGISYAGSDEIFIASQIDGNWQVVISLPEDMMIAVELRAEAKPER